MMPKSYKVACIALALASPVAAQPLWQNVEAGMTPEQVKALYPDAKQRPDKTEIKGFRPLVDCPANVHIMHPAGKVIEIFVRGKGSLGGGCSAKIMDALVAKYGMPLSKDTALPDSHYESRTIIWSKDGIMVRFEKTDGQGLIGTGWEMTYSTISREVGLSPKPDRRRYPSA